MIRRKSLLCNINHIQKTADLNTCELENFPDLSQVNCPACRTRGSFKPHGFYQRYVVDYVHGRIIVARKNILRVKCSSCGHTHALLKDFLIPYCQYTLRFILQVLKAYFRHSHTVSRICDMFQISLPTLYRWKHLFLLHRELWIGLVRSREHSPLFFLKFIDCHPDLSEFLHSFFLKLSFSFLQSHANPSYS